MFSCQATRFDLEAATLEFHRTFGLPVRSAPALPGPEEVALRERLLAEELTEYHQAARAGDVVEVADALADMAYVVAGTGHAFGMVLCPEEHHETYLDDAFTNYTAAVAAADLEQVATALSVMLRSIQAAAHTWRVPLDAVLAEVHRSNMSKLDENGRPVYRADGKVLKGARFFAPDVAGVLAALR